MSKPLCLDCRAPLEEIVEVSYQIKETGKVILPKPRCPKCRDAYDAQYTGPDGVLEKVS